MLRENKSGGKKKQSGHRKEKNIDHVTMILPCQSSSVKIQKWQVCQCICVEVTLAMFTDCNKGGSRYISEVKRNTTVNYTAHETGQGAF